LFRLVLVPAFCVGFFLIFSFFFSLAFFGLPRKAILETKRRTLLERRHLWGFLFEDEQRVFRRALIGPESEEEPQRNGAAA